MHLRQQLNLAWDRQLMPTLIYRQERYPEWSTTPLICWICLEILALRLHLLPCRPQSKPKHRILPERGMFQGDGLSCQIRISILEFRVKKVQVSIIVQTSIGNSSTLTDQTKRHQAHSKDCQEQD